MTARVSYPISNYFTLDRIDEDQAQDYAKRKGWDERDDEVVECSDEVILTSRNKIIILNKYSDIKVIHVVLLFA